MNLNKLFTKLVLVFFICGFTYWLNWIILMISSTTNFMISSRYYMVNDAECGDEFRKLAYLEREDAIYFYGIFK
jgi:hypothetical protein